MTDETNGNVDNAVDTEVTNETSKTPEMDYKKWFDDNKDKVEKSESIIAKNRELLSKLAKTKEQKELIEKQRMEQEGEWEKLYKDQQNKIRNKTVEGLAKEIGLKYAGDAEAAEALAELVERKVAELVNENGDYDVDDIAALKKDVETNKKYSRLLGNQNKGIGSGAVGNAKSTTVSSTTELTYEQYQQLSPTQKLAFSKAQQAGKAKMV